MKWVIAFFVFLFFSFFVLERLFISGNLRTKIIAPSKKTVSLLVFGDLMLDRYVGQKIKEKGVEYPFTKVKNLFEGSDLVLVNLEGPFTDFPPRNLHPQNLIFTFDPSLVPVLKKLGFNLFSLANNHTLNFGEEGLVQTKKYLKQNKIDYFGDQVNREPLSLIKEVKGIKIAFVGWNSLAGTDLKRVTEEIKNLRQKADFVVVFVHWGNEYQKTFSKSQQKESHLFIEAGADVVFGSHPHVVQSVEEYRGKKIFYSLGNFLFDQTFSSETQKGLGVRVVFDNEEITYELLPFKIENFQIKLSTEDTSR